MYLLDKLLGDNIAGSPKGGTGRDADVALCLCLVSGVDTGLIMQGGCREQYRAGDIIKHWL